MTQPTPKPTILIVDDEPKVVSAIRRALRKMPWDIFGFTDCQKALAELEKQKFDVVISDYRMLPMNGVEFLQLVRKRSPDTKRIMLTGQADFEAIEKAINESGVHKFLNKPWSDPHLLVTIQDCLEQSQLEAANRHYALSLEATNLKLKALTQDLEKQVADRTRALIQAEKMAALGRMAGGIAHEINNPLGGLLAFLQVLLRDPAGYSSEVKESLDTILDCGLRCKNIVDNLLSFTRKSKGDAGGYQKTSLTEIVSQAIFLSRLHPMAKQVGLETEIPDELPMVFGNHTLLEQVLVNLIQNGLQASSKGEAVRIRAVPEEGFIVLQVLDKGLGIEEEHLSHIFEPFFTTKDPGQGTGLGLFLSYGIIEDHGGLLTVESRPGEGSCFSIRLPVAST